ncbi:MAG: hypothetical protein AB9903_12365 [Vulcanimicrobiota bacterium]
MEISFKGVEYKSLAEMARKNTQDSEFIWALKEAGKSVLEGAVDTFFKTDREVADARETVQDLKDLEAAMKACYDNAKSIQDKAIEQKKQELADPKNCYISEKWTETPKVEMTDSGFEYCGDKRIETLKGVVTFINDLHNTIPLYTCVAMVPGPMSVSVKSFAKEIMSGSYRDTGRTESSSTSSAIGGSLLLLGGGVKSMNSKSITQNDAVGSVSYQKTSTDERVMPAIMDLTSRLDEMKLNEKPDALLAADFKITGTLAKEKKGWFRLGAKTVPATASDRNCGQVIAEHIWLPETGVSSYAGN